MTAKAKNHHYVPQSYLRRFSPDGTKIHVFDKSTRRSFTSNVKNVASETYFHDVPEDMIAKLLQHIEEHTSEFGEQDEMEQAQHTVENLANLEHRLSLLEAKLNDMLDKVIELAETNAQWMKTPPLITSLKTTTPQEQTKLVDRLIQAKPVEPSFKPDVAFLVAMQLIRTKEHRVSTTELIKKSSNAVSEMVLRMMGVDISKFDIQTDVNPEAEQLLHLEQMLDPTFVFGVADVLMNHIWIFEENSTTQPFFTSDNPVAVVPNKFSPHWHYTGYASEGIEIRMPLSPKYTVVFYERTHFAEMVNLEGKVLPVVENNVTRHNSIQINQSYRQIYSLTADFELAERTCREHPEVCNPERARFGGDHSV